MTKKSFVSSAAGDIAKKHSISAKNSINSLPFEWRLKFSDKVFRAFS